MKWYYFLQDALGVLIAYGNIRLIIMCIKYIIFNKGLDMFVFLKSVSAVIALVSGIWLLINRWSLSAWLMFLIMFVISGMLTLSANIIKKEVNKNETGKC